jgi:malic enzyme
VMGAGALGCAILQQSRATYRKKGEPGKRAGMVDQRGLTDYLIFYE